MPGSMVGAVCIDKVSTGLEFVSVCSGFVLIQMKNATEVAFCQQPGSADLFASGSGVGSNAHAQCIEFDKAACVGLIVCTTVFIKRRNIHVEQRIGF